MDRTDREPGPANLAEAAWIASERRWGQGWRRVLLPTVFLVYLVYVGQAASKSHNGAAAVAGIVIVAVFAAVYLLTLLHVERRPAWRFWVPYGLLAALFVAELPIAGAAAFVMCVYLAGMTVARMGTRSVPVIAAMTLAAIFVPVAVPSWHDGIWTGFQNVTAVAIPVVGLAGYGVTRVQQGNRSLAEARAELARLAAENERSRIARDLHDLLGHSLTTITVKAGLARRLGDTDPERALGEMAEVEALARQALADVRAAVSNYRDVTLAGELATGREVLRAAGITADLPRAADVVDPDHQELFGWVVREGLTNVVRHAHANCCTVTLSPCSVEIVDDGVGGTGTAGNGLSGLGERVAAAGGVVDAGPVQPAGWRLRVTLAPA